MYLPICRTGIDVLGSSGFCRAKIAPDKSTQDTVSSIRHNTAVLRMDFKFRFGMVGISIGIIKIQIFGSRITNEPIIKVPDSKMLVLHSFKFFTAAHIS